MISFYFWNFFQVWPPAVLFHQFPRFPSAKAWKEMPQWRKFFALFCSNVVGSDEEKIPCHSAHLPIYRTLAQMKRTPLWSCHSETLNSVTPKLDRMMEKLCCLRTTHWNWRSSFAWNEPEKTGISNWCRKIAEHHNSNNQSARNKDKESKWGQMSTVIHFFPEVSSSHKGTIVHNI